MEKSSGNGARSILTAGHLSEYSKVLIRLLMRKAFNSLTLRPLMLKTTYQAR